MPIFLGSTISGLLWLILPSTYWSTICFICFITWSLAGTFMLNDFTKYQNSQKEITKKSNILLNEALEEEEKILNILELNKKNNIDDKIVNVGTSLQNNELLKDLNHKLKLIEEYQNNK